VLGDLVDILFLTGLDRESGPSLATICAVHALGATLGCVLALVFPVTPLPLVLGALGAAFLLAPFRLAAAAAGAVVEATTFAGLGLLLGLLPR